MLGVMDGHGANGHQVSDFIKKTLPLTLANLIHGGNGLDNMHLDNKPST